MKKHSIKYMMGKKSCVLIKCSECPFRELRRDSIGPHNCYNIGVKKYLKQKKIKAILK